MRVFGALPSVVGVRTLIGIIFQVKAVVRLVVHNLLAGGTHFGHPWRFATGGNGFSELLVEAIHSPLEFFVLQDKSHDLVSEFGVGGGETGVGVEHGIQYSLVTAGSRSQIIEL